MLNALADYHHSSWMTLSGSTFSVVMMAARSRSSRPGLGGVEKQNKLSELPQKERLHWLSLPAR